MTLAGKAPQPATSASGAVPVAFVSSHARQGGSEKYLEWLIEGLDPAWVRLVVSLEEGPLTTRTRALGYPTVVIQTGTRIADLVRASWRLRSLLLETRPSVVHANGIKAAAVASLATVLTRVPFIWLKCDFSRDGLVSDLIAGRSTEVIAVSNAVTHTFGRRFQRKVRVIHTGVRETPAERVRGRVVVEGLFDGWQPRHVVLLVGRMEPDKGHLELLEAASAVLDRLPETGFVLLGGSDAPTEYTELLKRRVSELGLEHRVVFVPYRSDPSTIMAGSDVLVHPSIPVAGKNTEGFPLVALESLLVGTPVIGYANGGLPELVGECGRLVPRGDRAALAQALVDVLRDEELRAELSRAGQARVQSRFLFADHLEAMKRRYRAIAEPPA